MTPTKNRSLTEDLEIAYAFSDHLEALRPQLLSVLSEHETHEAATDEIERSVKALRGLHREFEHLRSASGGDLAVFLPVNLPLYSLVLFAAVPSIMAERVFVRVPAVTPRWARDIFELTAMRSYFPRVGLYELNRADFLSHFASASDAIVFTGRYENARKVMAACHDSAIVFNGAGVNPVVVGEGADLEANLDRILTPRLFNSGQDCAGPDCYLVHTSQSSQFIDRASAALRRVEVGDYSRSSVRVGEIANPGPLSALADRLGALQSATVVGGKVDVGGRFVEPTLVVRPLDSHDRLFEFFAPVVYVLIYENDDDLAEFFRRVEYTDFAMYASFFGARVPESLTASTRPLINQTVLEVEDGNEAYGGWGPKANFVARGAHHKVGPVLISEALAGLRPLRTR